MKLDLTNDQIHTSMIVEASAGTGKTYAVAALVARELAVRADLRDWTYPDYDIHAKCSDGITA